MFKFKLLLISFKKFYRLFNSNFKLFLTIPNFYYVNILLKLINFLVYI